MSVVLASVQDSPSRFHRSSIPKKTKKLAPIVHRLTCIVKLGVRPFVHGAGRVCRLGEQATTASLIRSMGTPVSVLPRSHSTHYRVQSVEGIGPPALIDDDGAP